MATTRPCDRQPVDSRQNAVEAGPAGVPLCPPDHAVAGPGEEVAGRTQQLSLLVEVNAELAGALDVESVLEGALSRLADRERLIHACVYRLDEPAKELLRVACGGKNGASPRAVSLREANLLAWTVRQREPAYVPWTGRDPRCQAFGRQAQSVYVVPLQTLTGVLGVLDVASDQPDGIRAVTRKLIDQVAVQAALALERSDLYRQLRISEERFRSIFEQSHIGVALAGLDGRFSTVNPALAHMLGYSQEELQGRHFTEVTKQQDAAEIAEQVRTLGEVPAGQVTLEARYVRKSGESAWCATTISMLRDAAGSPASILGMVHDIDERKKAEEERDRLQRQLFQAQKMEALGTLAGGIAHDFNNLLSVMLGFASLARQRLGTNDPLQEPLGMIEQSAQRAADLARQLLGLARPERQSVKPVCVGEVLDRVRRMVARTFDRNIHVVVDIRHEPLWVNAEPSFLEQALLNLCINARDAMPEGGTLTLEAGVTRREDGALGEADLEDNPGEDVSISVQDTGAGIPLQTLPRIFDPFFTTKEPGRGTGLGLAMVQGFAKNHNGSVKVASEPGQGARFTLSLPRIPPPHSPQDAIPPQETQLGGGTVLVVDDEPLVRAFATAGVKGLGYNALAAENGQQALDILTARRAEIDCVLLDLIMPELSGLDVYRRMRAIDPELRVVFASGCSTGGILRDAPDARSAAFLAKPYTLEGLSLALRGVGMGSRRQE